MHTVLGLILLTIWGQAPLASAQEVALTAGHNVTSLLGTWSSGSRAVRTGVVSDRAVFVDV